MIDSLTKLVQAVDGFEDTVVILIVAILIAFIVFCTLNAIVQIVTREKKEKTPKS